MSNGFHRPILHHSGVSHHPAPARLSFHQPIQWDSIHDSIHDPRLDPRLDPQFNSSSILRPSSMDHLIRKKSASILRIIIWILIRGIIGIIEVPHGLRVQLGGRAPGDPLPLQLGSLPAAAELWGAGAGLRGSRFAFSTLRATQRKGRLQWKWRVYVLEIWGSWGYDKRR